MIIFILPILLVAWFEASWSSWLNLAGANLPLTLLVILYLRYRAWIGLSETLLLAGIGGYLLDTLASPRPGWLMLAMVAAAGLSGWLLGRDLKRWQRWAALGLAPLVYQLVLSIGLGWSEPGLAGLQLLVLSGCSLVLFALMRLIGRRIEGWL